MSSRMVLLLVLTLIVASGCGQKGDLNSGAAAARLRTPADDLAATDLDRFVAIIEAQGVGTIPEFTPEDDDVSLDHTQRASELVDGIRRRFYRMFDVERQGRLWENDDTWSGALKEHRISGPEFAALVQSIGCAVMRVRLDARVDVARLLANARAEVREIVETMDAIDAIPADDQTRENAANRARFAIQLTRLVALREFSEMVEQVPFGNCELVRKYSRQLKPLLPRDGASGLLSELQALGESRPAEVVPAGHER